MEADGPTKEKETGKTGQNDLEKQMRVSFAPMEGITGYVYRNAFHRCFGGVSKYYTPFLSPGPEIGLPKRAVRDVIPEHNRGVPVVPQILTRRAEDFLEACAFMRDLGYREVNLNLGCPSGTVVAKGKGSGFLSDPDALRSFFDAVFRALPEGLTVTVKTRIGRWSPEEFPALLDLFNEFPIAELIIHPRIQKEFYRGEVHRDVFLEAMEKSRIPLTFNGDLFTAEDILSAGRDFPALDSVMLGRGLLADPFLAGDYAALCGGEAVKADDAGRRKQIGSFHDLLIRGYLESYGDEHGVLCRMKELWSYLGESFPGEERTLRAMKKAKKLGEFLDAAAGLF